MTIKRSYHPEKTKNGEDYCNQSNSTYEGELDHLFKKFVLNYLCITPKLGIDFDIQNGLRYNHKQTGEAIRKMMRQ